MSYLDKFKSLGDLKKKTKNGEIDRDLKEALSVLATLKSSLKLMEYRNVSIEPIIVSAMVEIHTQIHHIILVQQAFVEQIEAIKDLGEADD